jgi:hypothetical protein
MADRSPHLFRAIYAALAADAPLTALIGANRVFDQPPAAALPTYVTIGDETARDYGSSAGDAQEHTVTIHTWSAQPSSVTCKEIMAAVRAALHEQPLALSAGRLVYLRQEFKETMRDPDGVTQHGLQRFRALTEN